MCNRPSVAAITAGARALTSRAYIYRADGHLSSVADQLSGTRTFDLAASCSWRTAARRAVLS